MGGSRLPQTIDRTLHNLAKQLLLVAFAGKHPVIQFVGQRKDDVQVITIERPLFDPLFPESSSRMAARTARSLAARVQMQRVPMAFGTLKLQTAKLAGAALEHFIDAVLCIYGSVSA